ncbi:MAG: isoprenoid biosynthesis glyoxalase ElbB [Phycisphaerales bacterium]|nr:isoprenoid biosynthesis glyoxalase ElbB [Phycisphaerales bacterium]
MPRIALVLSGCGFMDGSEIHESVSCLIHLSRHGAEVSCFAPDKPQAAVVNHATGKPAGSESRNVLVESARIARGKIRPLRELRAAGFDAVVFPGGFGAAKNLSNFATAGAACEVDADTARAIKEFHAAGKPVGLCCIAPVLAARVLGTKAGGPGVSVTVGNDEGVAKAIVGMGSTHADRAVNQSHIDVRNRVVTAPAYMYGDAPVHDVFDGIGEMIDGVIERVTAAASTRGQSRSSRFVSSADDPYFTYHPPGGSD